MQHTFARLLPREPASQFLRACVDPSADGQAEWHAWRARYILQDELERDGTGTKRLLPLLAYTLEQGSVGLDAGDARLLRAARFREQLRAEKIRSILREALAALQQAGVDVFLLKGAALSQTVYPNPDLRHTHDIDLLVRVSDLVRAGGVLRSVNFSGQPALRAIQSGDVYLVHPSGLPLVLHTTLFQTQSHSLPASEIWATQIPLELDGVETRILSPEIMLVHVLGQTFYSSTRRFCVWVSDAYFLANHTPAFDWGRVTEMAIRAKIALPLLLTLDYLQRALRLPVPPAVLRDLQYAASKMSQAEYESALTLLRRNGQGGYRHWLKTAHNPHERMRVARWVAHSYSIKQ